MEEQKIKKEDYVMSDRETLILPTNRKAKDIKVTYKGKELKCVTGLIILTDELMD